jgi:hypothetical protein
MAVAKSFPKMRCPKCEAIAPASCDCGVGYVPLIDRAKIAISKNPDKSSRAIAEDAGVSRQTVDRARNQLAQDGPVEHVDEPRTGRDNRTRKMPKKKKPTTDKSILSHENAHVTYFTAAQKMISQLDDLFLKAPRRNEPIREKVEELEKCLKSVNERLPSVLDRCRWFLSGDDGDQRDDSVHCAAASNASRTNGNGAAN